MCYWKKCRETFVLQFMYRRDGAYLSDWRCCVFSAGHITCRLLF